MSFTTNPACFILINMKLLSILFILCATISGVLTQVDYQAACDGKSSGDPCAVTFPDGTTESYVCFQPFGSNIACGPDFDNTKTCLVCANSEIDDTIGYPADGNNNTSDSYDNGNVKENAAVSACESKDENDSCVIMSPDGTKNVGVCSDQGADACGPDWNTSIACYLCSRGSSSDSTSNNDGDSEDAGVQQTNECDNKKIGDSCTVERSSGDKAGICADTGENSDTGDGQLSCQPADTNTAPPSEATIADDQPISSAITDACSSSSSGDSCSYKDPDGNTITGTCETNNGGK